MSSTHDKFDVGGALAYETYLCQLDTLCLRLELLADALPSRVDTRVAELLARTLQHTLVSCHLFEKNVVFPVLLHSHPELNRTIARLETEHVEDEDQAYELTDAILTFIILQKRQDAEELGYILRCLFTSLRRHLAFDRDYVLPLYCWTTSHATIKPLQQPLAH